MEKKELSSSEDEFLELSDDLEFPASDEEKPKTQKRNFQKRYPKRYQKPKKPYNPKPYPVPQAKDASSSAKPTNPVPPNPEVPQVAPPTLSQAIIPPSSSIPSIKPQPCQPAPPLAEGGKASKKKSYKKKFVPKPEAEEFKPKTLTWASNAESFNPSSSQSKFIPKASAPDFEPSNKGLSSFVPKETAEVFSPLAARTAKESSEVFMQIDKKINFVPKLEAAEFRPAF